MYGEANTNYVKVEVFCEGDLIWDAMLNQVRNKTTLSSLSFPKFSKLGNDVLQPSFQKFDKPLLQVRFSLETDSSHCLKGCISCCRQI